MSTYKIHSEIVDFHGYLTIATYVHYFVPGSLKIQTKRHRLSIDHLRELIDTVYDPIRFENTRRWLPQGEAPFPGYCRSPGSGTCMPSLCNCKMLVEKWNDKILLMQEERKKLNSLNQSKKKKT